MNADGVSDGREALRRWTGTPGSRVHLMGIGGIGMAGLARLLAARGLEVSGCDAAAPRTMAWLESCGISVQTGHDPAHLAGVDWAVFSPAVPEGQAERMAAEPLGIPLFRRGQVLPVLAENRRTVAVAGTHGKTTTSSMIAHILRACGADPSWCIGGELPPDGAPAGIGASERLVIEADESDGTLSGYAPELAVITNIEFDHMEHFADEHGMRECFRTFARQARVVLHGADDPEASRLGAQVGGASFGFAAGADYRAERVRPSPDGTRFTLRAPGGRRVEARVPLTGRHHVANALAALAACDRCGIGIEAAAGALASFALPRRRFERVADAHGIRIIADYAHHPSEIRALIDAARQAGATRIRAVFQPHRHTRTRALGEQFPPAFDGVDDVMLTPVYAASEPPMEGGMSEDLLRHFQRHGRTPVELAADLQDAADRVAARWMPGDWILIVGAGDVETIGPILKQKLENDPVHSSRNLSRINGEMP